MEQIWTFFTFPLNLLLAVIWTVGWRWLWKNHCDNVVIRFMLSPKATVSSIVLLIASCLWIGFTGNTDFVQSIFFVILLLFVQTVLFLVILRGWRRSDGVVRWRFLFIHAGLLIALSAGFWGSPDSYEVRIQLEHGESAREAYRLDGGMSVLSYELSLEDFITEMSADGKPVYYEAVVRVDGGEPVRITVNHPYGVKFGEDIYLASVSDSGCVFQIVREPWRYFALTGIIMLIAGAFMLFTKGPGR